MVKAWGQRPPAISWETLQVELFHMAHQRVVLVEIMLVPAGHIRCLLNALGMDGDSKAPPACHGRQATSTCLQQGMTIIAPLW